MGSFLRSLREILSPRGPESAKAAAPARRPGDSGRSPKEPPAAPAAAPPAASPAAPAAAPAAGEKQAPPATSPAAPPAGETQTPAAEALEPAPATPGGSCHSSYDEEGPRELFAGIAAAYSQPIKDLVFELRRGTATKDWIEICMPVLASVIHGAESLGLSRAAERMVALREALALAEQTQGRGFDDDSRQHILAAYQKLADEMPIAFALGDEGKRRESIMVHALLRQVPGVGRVTLDKLYGAGLTTIDALFLATPVDIAVTTGIALPLSEAICARLREHRARREGVSPEAGKLERHARLSGLVDELRLQQERFQRVTAASHLTPELEAEKHECLRRRQAALLQVDVLLAEMGEVDLVDELRRLAIERRADRLDQLLFSESEPLATATGTAAATGMNNDKNKKNQPPRNGGR